MSSVLDKQFIFIIGAPKSGTTWLQIMISAHPQVCTTVELTLFSKYTAPWIKAWKAEAANIQQGRWNQGLPFLWSEDEFYGYLKEFLSKVYEKVLSINPQATHVLDKHPGYSMHVEDINMLLPGARFIHMIRDGRDVAVSMVAAQQRIGYGTGTIQDSAAEWKRNVRAAQETTQYHDRYMEVRYEDLLISGANTLKSVFDFCGLPATHNEVTAIIEEHKFDKMKAQRQHADKRAKTSAAFYRKGKIGSWQEEIQPVQRYVFDVIAGDLLCKLGYAKDGWWTNSIKQKFTLPILYKTMTMRNNVRRAAAALLGPTLTGYIKAFLSKTNFRQ